MIILIVIFFGLVFFFYAPGLIHKKYWAELVLFCVFLFVGFGISILHSLGIPLPYISDVIGKGIGNTLGIK